MGQMSHGGRVGRLAERIPDVFNGVEKHLSL